MTFLIEEVHDEAFRFNAVVLLRSDIPSSLRDRIVQESILRNKNSAICVALRAGTTTLFLLSS
jgi:hypothetical protein